MDDKLPQFLHLMARNNSRVVSNRYQFFTFLCMLMPPSMDHSPNPWNLPPAPKCGFLNHGTAHTTGRRSYSSPLSQPLLVFNLQLLLVPFLPTLLAVDPAFLHRLLTSLRRFGQILRSTIVLQVLKAKELFGGISIAPNSAHQ